MKVWLSLRPLLGSGISPCVWVPFLYLIFQDERSLIFCLGKHCYFVFCEVVWGLATLVKAWAFATPSNMSFIRPLQNGWNNTFHVQIWCNFVPAKWLSGPAALAAAQAWPLQKRYLPFCSLHDWGCPNLRLEVHCSFDAEGSKLSRLTLAVARAWVLKETSFPVSLLVGYVESCILFLNTMQSLQKHHLFFNNNLLKFAWYWCVFQKISFSQVCKHLNV